MLGSVLQNKKYMKFASERTVEVIAVSALDSGISKGDARAGTYKAKDENGKEVEYLVSWPGLTIADMKKLSRSKAPGYNDTRGIPYVAIVNPHTLEKFAGWNGGSSGKIMDAVDEAQKALKKEYGKPVSRKDLMKVRKEENKVRKLLKAGDLGGDQSKNSRDTMTLLEVVAPKARLLIHLVGEVQVTPLHELFPGFLVTDLPQHRMDDFMGQDFIRDRADITV